jgi:hypothetical protein
MQIVGSDFAAGTLERTSYVRPDKLFTASPTIVLRKVGSLSDGKTAEVRAVVAGLFC